MAQMNGKMNILYILAAFFAMYSCGSGNATETVEPVNETIEMQQDTVEVVAADTATIYSDVVSQKNCFILISKPEYRLYVCEVVDGDTVKRAHFPVCVGKAKGQKQKKGDMKRMPPIGITTLATAVVASFPTAIGSCASRRQAIRVSASMAAPTTKARCQDVAARVASVCATMT